MAKKGELIMATKVVQARGKNEVIKSCKEPGRTCALVLSSHVPSAARPFKIVKIVYD
jgi:hypothetical protein